MLLFVLPKGLRYRLSRFRVVPVHIDLPSALSPAHRWLLAERLALSQRLLESTEQSVEAIAALAGFGSPVSLRHHFGRAFGVSPSAWRHSFCGG